MTLIIIVILLILVLGAYPRAPWYGPTGANWGYGPMGGLGLILVILLILILLGYPGRLGW